MGIPAGKVALVTGASRGIGAAIAVELARAGVDVAINYCRSEAKAREVLDAVEKLGRRAMLVQADVAQKAEIDRMFDAVEAAWGKVDILVNNAGIEERWPTRECREANYDAIMDTNVKGTFFCAQRALEGMKPKGWGRLINVSSVHEVKATNFCSVYGISKGALQLLVRELALEYSRYHYHGTDFHDPGPYRSSDHDPVVLGLRAYTAP
jgi:NAD(P)-dependent dehydrogenase (short-subunit alcohol dehydrogenase family)